jgi:GT2 family glycosyltransferase
MNEVELSIIIVSFNVKSYLLDCIDSVVSSVHSIDYEVIVVDNASQDGSAEAVGRKFPGVRLVANPNNVGFAAANNQGHSLSSGEFILLLNPDTMVKGSAIENVFRFMKATPAAGLAACRQLKPDGSLQKSTQPFPSILEHLLRAFFLDRIFYWQYWKRTYFQKVPFEIDYPTGAFMMVRRQALRERSLLNPKYFMYSEEKDLALRLKKNGWKVYFVPSAEVIHYGGQSTGQVAEDMFLELQKSQVKFFILHYQRWYRDIMIWTHWIILCTSCLASIPFAVTAYGRLRFKLFARAFVRYPEIVKKTTFS